MGDVVQLSMISAPLNVLFILHQELWR